jgi:hypothetical protein
VTTVTPEAHTDTALALAAAATTACQVLPGCIVDHTDPEIGDSYHYTLNTWTGPIATSVEITTAGEAVLAIGNGSDPERLDAGETGALIAALTAHHERMTELTAQLAATIANRGAR